MKEARGRSEKVAVIVQMNIPSKIKCSDWLVNIFAVQTSNEVTTCIELHEINSGKLVSPCRCTPRKLAFALIQVCIVVGNH